MTYQPVTKGPDKAKTYVACVGVPGYPPSVVEGGFASVADAWAFLTDERENQLDCDPPHRFRDRVWLELHLRADAEEETCEPGAVFGNNPGFGDDDLGLFYSVEVEE